MRPPVASGAWLAPPGPRPAQRIRLFCFPYAGAGASLFRGWSAELPVGVDVRPVQLPGRENRVMEAPFVRLGPLVQALAEALGPQLDIPFACFGHSMGTLISFELARELRRQKRPGPVCLFVSGHRAPHLPDPNPPIHALPDALFVRELRRLNGTSEQALEHAELRQLLLPVLRADFALCETYAYSVEEPLDCPIAAFGGLQDDRVSRMELAAWRDHTRAACTLRMLAGNHFYLHGVRTRLLDAIAHDLTERLLTQPDAAR